MKCLKAHSLAEALVHSAVTVVVGFAELAAG